MRTAVLLCVRVRAMRGRAAWVGLLIAIATLAICPRTAKAQADNTHYQTLQLGERSRGMAGAYTAYAADGAAIWFNPAGLPLLEPRLLQGSLSLIQRRTVDIQGAVAALDERPLEAPHVQLELRIRQRTLPQESGDPLEPHQVRRVLRAGGRRGDQQPGQAENQSSHGRILPGRASTAPL